VALFLAVMVGLVAACGAETGGASSEEEPTASPSTTSGSPSVLVDGPASPARYVIMPPEAGWAECADWVTDCPPEPPLARSLRVEITVPAGWEAGLEATVLVPSSGSFASAAAGPDGAGLVIGWSGHPAGLHSDPCLPVPHSAPDIPVGPSADEFVDAILAHPSLQVSEPTDVKVGGYRGQFLRLITPSDISACRDWRPFESGIAAQGTDNLWSIWVIDVDGFRMVVLTEAFAGTPKVVNAELRSMVGSIRFLP